jgi:A/G-specific adenine glycosylase
MSKLKTPTPDRLSRTIAAALEAWFAENARDYPWRRTQDPYAILVSEVMLQQTQIPTVLDRGYYTRWMDRFPDLANLAAAEEKEVLSAWEGLGYYRRARNLQRLAQIILQDHGGVFPRDFASIRALPGVGPYTAGAVASFAFDEAAPIVDGNVARVLARVYDDATPVDSTLGQKALWARAESLVKAAQSPRAFNGALMELGQRVCRTGQPDCVACPLKPHCATKTPEQLPVKIKKTVTTEVTERVFFLRENDCVLLHQETGSRRTGLWKLPALPPDTLPPVLHKSTYAITRYKVTLWVHDAPPARQEIENAKLVPIAELASLPMPSPYRRALAAVMKHAEFTLEA